MITLLDGYPDDVLAISATGQVTVEDYRDILIPEAESRLQRHAKLRFLFLFGDTFERLGPGAMLADAGFGFGHRGTLGRTAFVTDVAWIADAARIFVPFFHMPFRVFPAAEFDQASAWVLEEETPA